MTQGSFFKILLTAMRVDELSGFIFGHRIDRQISALQVFFETYTRMEINFKTVIAMPLFLLGSRQGVLFAGLRVQKHGK